MQRGKTRTQTSSPEVRRISRRRRRHRQNKSSGVALDDSLFARLHTKSNVKILLIKCGEFKWRFFLPVFSSIRSCRTRFADDLCLSTYIYISSISLPSRRSLDSSDLSSTFYSATRRTDSSSTQVFPLSTSAVLSPRRLYTPLSSTPVAVSSRCPIQSIL
jgi:hypothetical protein